MGGSGQIVRGTCTPAEFSFLSPRPYVRNLVRVTFQVYVRVSRLGRWRIPCASGCLRDYALSRTQLGLLRSALWHCCPAVAVSCLLLLLLSLSLSLLPPPFVSFTAWLCRSPSAA